VVLAQPRTERHRDHRALSPLVLDGRMESGQEAVSIIAESPKAS
jgi:hypothetical protein